MVYAAAPTSALPNGVIFSLSQGQLQLHHAADSGTSVFIFLLSLYTLLKHLFLCVWLFALSVLFEVFCCFYLARVLQFRRSGTERDAALFVHVNSAAYVVLTTPLFCFYLFLKTIKRSVDFKLRISCMPHKLLSFLDINCVLSLWLLAVCMRVLTKWRFAQGVSKVTRTRQEKFTSRNRISRSVVVVSVSVVYQTD
jgi:hypothetical protein